MGSKKRNWNLYPACLREISRICRPGTGRAALLTQDKKCFAKVCASTSVLECWQASFRADLRIFGWVGCFCACTCVNVNLHTPLCFYDDLCGTHVALTSVQFCDGAHRICMFCWVSSIPTIPEVHGGSARDWTWGFMLERDFITELSQDLLWWYLKLVFLACSLHLCKNILSLGLGLVIPWSYLPSFQCLNFGHSQWYLESQEYENQT